MNAATTTGNLELVQATDLQPNAGALVTTKTPRDLLALAVTQGAAVETLERLWALHVQFEEREAKKQCVEALASFKSEPLTIFKRKQVGYTTSGGDFVGYQHAELSDITEVVVPAMAKHGLSHRWDVVQDAGRIVVSCIVTHKAGHSMTVTMDAAPDNSGKKNSIQQIASAVTYLQRYTLLAVTGMATTGMDDDGNGAGGGQGAGNPPPPAPPAQAGTRSWPADAFERQFARWEKAVTSGLKSVADIVAMARTKGNLTPEQEGRIRAIAK